MTKLMDHLLAVKAKQEAEKLAETHQVMIDEALVEQQKRKDAGITKEQKSIVKHRKEIYDRLVKLVPEGWVKWKDTYFNEMTNVRLETYKDWENNDAVHVAHDGGGGHWHAGDFSMHYKVYINFTQVWRSEGRFRGGYTGNYTLAVGDYGDKRTFRQLKNGGYKYDEVAQEIAHRMQRLHKLAVAEAKRRALAHHAEEVKTQFGVKDYGAVQLSASANDDKPVAVKVECTRNLNKEDAVRLVALLKELGIGYYN